MNGLVLLIAITLPSPSITRLPQIGEASAAMAAAADTSVYIENVIWPPSRNARTAKSVSGSEPTAALRLVPAQKSRGAQRP
jgi:hypothetical protein